jgi:toxin CcdB
MARHDVYAFPVGSGRLVVDVQADLLDGLSTRIVVPLVAEALAPPALNRLNPKFQIDGMTYVFLVQYAAPVPEKYLRNPLCSLSAETDAITSALDMLFQGF